ncbi:MAG: DUF4974 domain-containing protein [Flavobacterium sp.]|nr:MAG: DUF4974 domain-containing protein [Flavobacterium sp.]
MMMENTDDTFLAEWLDGRLTDEQLRAKVSANDFESYLQLRESLAGLEIADPDMQRNYVAIKQKKIAGLNAKPKVLQFYRYAAIAALLLVFVGLYQLFVFSNHAMTDYGESQTVVLADNSKVTLNARSEVSFPSLFSYNRTLKLSGEAYFEVQKGSTFTVKTAGGDVMVLGTKFNVIAREGFFEAVCYEGKVSVSNDKFSVILLPGEAIRFYGENSDTWKVANKKPLWTTGESEFRNTPLQYVIDDVENQYNLQIELPKNFMGARFTGTFTHRDLNTALQSVCIPMNLKFTKTPQGKIVISE